MTERDFTCRGCGLSGSARWMVTHGHHRWSSWLLGWLGDFSALMSPRQLDGKRLWEDRAGKHRRRLFPPASLCRRLRGTAARGAWCAMRTMRPMYRYSDETVARACWRALDVMNDSQGLPWSAVPFEPFEILVPGERDIVLAGVRGARQGYTPRELWELWAVAKRALGWTWGPMKDAARKLHPNLVEHYLDLPPSQRDKDRVFLAVVVSMTLTE